MNFFNILLAFVFLVGNDAALPKVGSCTSMEFYCNARKCETTFIKTLQKDPKANCGVEVQTLKNCIARVLKICVRARDSKTKYQVIKGIINIERTITEEEFCPDGSMEIPDMSPTGGSICSASFSSDANTCLRSFHQKFADDKSDPALCSEHAKAKRCLKNLIDSDCNFPAQGKQLLELAYGDYNPFCANNRDPGATGNDQCDGVQDISKYLSAAAEIKSDVLKTLILAFLLLLFFFKV